MSPMSAARARLLALVLVAGAVVVVVGCSGDKPRIEAGNTIPPATTVPTTAQPTTSTTEPEPFWDVATSTAVGQQEIFDAPDGGVVTTLPNPWIGDSPLVFLVKDRSDDDWYEVYLPIKPNGSTGFVRAGDVDLVRHHWSIEVRLSEFRLVVRDGDDVFLDTQIAVAAENTPTPGGLYYTTELRGPYDPNNAYGTYAYGLSGYSEVEELQSFNGGDGQLGIHGTNQPELIGSRVSHGCIRMRNEDIDKLAPLLPLGVPVEVIP